MKVNELKILFISVWLLFGSWMNCQASEQKAQIGSSQLKIEKFFPQINLSYEGLDPRDENNNPIKNSIYLTRLETIFQSGLYDILVCAELPAIANALSIISKKLNLSVDFLIAAIPFYFGQIITGLPVLLKKYIFSNLTFFSGFLPFKLILIFIVLCSISGTPSLCARVSLPLRC